MKVVVRILFVIIPGSGFIAFSWFFGGFFGETDVCTHCGAFRSMNRYLWIPSKSAIMPTALSLYLYQQSLPGNTSQDHRWILVQGSGGPITCTLGHGCQLVGAIDDDDVVNALKNIRQHLGDDAAKLWTSRLLDPQTSPDAYPSIEPLATAGDFDKAYARATRKFEREYQLRHH